MDARGKFGEHEGSVRVARGDSINDSNLSSGTIASTISTQAQEARVALGYCLEQLLRFPRALQTSRVHP